jgi:hypothetical protein
MFWQASTGRQLAAPLAQIGKTEDGVDHIVVRGQLQSVDACLVKSRPKLRLTALRGGRKAPSESAVVSIDE